jgi:hypothetical protein
MTLVFPPKENKEVMEKNTTHEGKVDWSDKLKPRITLYRGLGLPEKAI